MIHSGSVNRDRGTGSPVRIVRPVYPGSENPGLEHGELDKVTTIKRQIPDLLVIDQGSKGGRRCFHERGLGGYSDLLADVAWP